MKLYDFNQLMGKGKRCWKHVKSPADFAHLKEFEDLYLRFINKKSSDNVIIPEILHFVWVGSKEYPETSRNYLLGWMKFHPSWKVIFWSDRVAIILAKNQTSLGF